MPMSLIYRARSRNGRQYKSAPRFEREGSITMEIELTYTKVGDYYIPNLAL